MTIWSFFWLYRYQLWYGILLLIFLSIQVYPEGKQKRNISRHGRKATIRDFYGTDLLSLWADVLPFLSSYVYSDLVCFLIFWIPAIILPSLQRIHGSLDKFDDCKDGHHWIEMSSKKRGDKDGRLMNIDMKREDECGICLEPCTRMVLPNCCHSMCIKCYRNW